jgi:hypothetical protein
MKTATVIILMLAAVTASAKDKAYSTGIIERRMVNAGFVDTTKCSDRPDGVHCGGGISEEYAPHYTLIFADGTKHHIEHVGMARDTLKKMDFSNGPITVQYRIEHRRGFGGVDYAVIEDPVTHKEGAYSFDTLKVRQ